MTRSRTMEKSESKIDIISIKEVSDYVWVVKDFSGISGYKRG